MPNYYDTPSATALGSASQVDKALVDDIVSASSLGIGGPELDHGVFHILVSATAIGRGSEKDAQHSTTSIGASSLASAVVKNAVKARDIGVSHSLGIASVTSFSETISAGTAKAIGRGSQSDHYVTHSLPVATANGIGGVTNRTIVHDTTQASSLGSGSVTSRTKWSDKPYALARGSASDVDTHGNNAHIGASGKGSANAMAFTSSFSVAGAKGLGSGQLYEPVPSLAGDLITCCRYWCYQSFPEIVSKGTGYLAFPEAYPPMGRQMQDGDLPLCAIIAGQPAPFTQAVLDSCQRVQVDFVYCNKTYTDGLTDTAEYVRSRLDALRTNLLRDFQLTKANGGVVLCQDSREVADPLNKVQSYQGMFTPDNVNVTALVLSFQFDLVTTIYKI